MRLQTLIPPRADGRLIVRSTTDPQVAYVFTMDDDRMLSGEVDDAPTIERLIGLGDFFPADPALLEGVTLPSGSLSDLRSEGQSEDPGLGDSDGDDADDDLGYDTESSGDGMPIEANTPIKNFKGGRKASRAAAT